MSIRLLTAILRATYFPVNSRVILSGFVSKQSEYGLLPTVHIWQSHAHRHINVWRTPTTRYGLAIAQVAARCPSRWCKNRLVDFARALSLADGTGAASLAVHLTVASLRTYTRSRTAHRCAKTTPETTGGNLSSVS